MTSCLEVSRLREFSIILSIAGFVRTLFFYINNLAIFYHSQVDLLGTRDAILLSPPFFLHWPY